MRRLWDAARKCFLYLPNGSSIHALSKRRSIFSGSHLDVLLVNIDAGNPSLSSSDISAPMTACVDARNSTPGLRTSTAEGSVNRGLFHTKPVGLQGKAGGQTPNARLVTSTVDPAIEHTDDEFQRAQRIASGHLIPHDVQWLMKGFAAFLASGGSVSLERCLRLPCNDAAMRRACRNYWLGKAWSSLGHGASPWRCSESLAVAIRDFRSQQWPLWRTLTRVPSDVSELQVALFHAFRSHERIPCTAMQLHNIARHYNDTWPIQALTTVAAMTSPTAISDPRSAIVGNEER